MNTLEIKTGIYDVCKSQFDPPLSKNDINILVNAFLSAISTAIIEEDRATLRDFGTFKKIIRKGRTFKVRGKEVTVPDRETVIFKPGKGLKALLTSKTP